LLDRYQLKSILSNVNNLIIRSIDLKEKKSVILKIIYINEINKRKLIIEKEILKKINGISIMGI
jgi:hypothetical protein